MTHTFGSLFAGVGGFDLGFENAGFECRFQVEWDKHCQQTLAHHWPDIPRWGDVSEVNGADLPPVDVITYGFPCQDLSLAGKRAGLDGGRSGLFFQAVRIIKEMREATNGRYPTWAVAENVAGLLNADNGHAMGRCIDELAEAGSLVIEWCLVDAQWFGVPQRRRRVFLASCFDPATAERCPDPLFPIGESSSRNLVESLQKRQETARTLREGSSQGCWSADDGLTIGFSHTQGLDPQPSQHHFPTLRSEGAGQAVAQPIAFSAGNSAHARSIAITENGTPPLRAGASGTNQTPTVMTPDLAVRRLTPLECERLMGWPDDHTLHRADGKTNADSTRYKMCGNGIVAPVSRWIAKHLANTLTDD